MNCNKCGTENKDSAATCENCGNVIETGVKKNIYTYDYKTVETNHKNAMEVVDCYEAMGWELADKSDSYNMSGNVSLNFRRNRKITNKDQLNRLQVKLDDSINGISIMEKRKTQNACIVSLIIGIIGILIFGGGLSMCLMLPYSEIVSYTVGCILAVIGIAVAAPAYVVYKKISSKATMKMNVLIDKKRDEISRLCEDAQNLIA